MVLKNIPAISISALAKSYQSDWKTQDLFVSREQPLLRGPERAVRTDGYIIGICSRGTARFELDLQAYSASKYCMVAITPRHLYKLEDISPDFLCRFIVFSKAFLLASSIHIHLLESFAFFKPNTAPFRQIEGKAATELLDYLRLLEEKFYRTNYPFQLEIIRNLLLSFLYEIEGGCPPKEPAATRKLSRKEELFDQFQHLLFRHFKQERGVRFYADRLFVSPKYLSETIKDVSGRPAGKWIEEAVILEAKVLLRQPAMNVAKVAEALHFPNQSFFGKYFKKNTGKSPSAYLR